MTWKSHIAIATACTIPFNPALIPAAALGSTAPDWSEWILKFFGIQVQHRGITHYLYIPFLFILLSFVIDFKSIIFWFGIGYLTHWVADSLTPSGVPISQFDNHRIHLFGGRIRTGSFMEYILAFGFLLLVVSLVKPLDMIKNRDDLNNYFNVYFNDYGKMYEQKIIDEKTYKENRFNLF
jgi:inner membrane protein